ncbi:acyl dehydratase [Bacillus sp. TE9106W]|nr:MaoC/PaaZ C-terminal domain-containing protein [Bacillus cereus]
MEYVFPEITNFLLLKYAEASGDYNPIHISEEVAKQIGYKNVIAHGMLLMGFAHLAICDWFPEDRLEEFKIKFVNVTYPGDNLICLGRITKQVKHGGEVIYGSFKIVDTVCSQTKCLGKFKIRQYKILKE